MLEIWSVLAGLKNRKVFTFRSVFFLGVELRRLLLFLLVFSLLTPVVRGEEKSVYCINVFLDVDNAVVYGNLSLEYFNCEEVELDELVFHVYPNAFRDVNGWIEIFSVCVDGSSVDYVVCGDDGGGL